jgi:hypothetical protein
MDRTILQEFVNENIVANDLEQIREKFEVYRMEWVERMV